MPRDKHGKPDAAAVSKSSSSSKKKSSSSRSANKSSSRHHASKEKPSEKKPNKENKRRALAEDDTDRSQSDSDSSSTDVDAQRELERQQEEVLRSATRENLHKARMGSKGNTKGNTKGHKTKTKPSSLSLKKKKSTRAHLASAWTDVDAAAAVRGEHDEQVATLGVGVTVKPKSRRRVCCSLLLATTGLALGAVALVDTLLSDDEPVFGGATAQGEAVRDWFGWAALLCLSFPLIFWVVRFVFKTVLPAVLGATPVYWLTGLGPSVVGAGWGVLNVILLDVILGDVVRVSKGDANANANATAAADAPVGFPDAPSGEGVFLRWCELTLWSVVVVSIIRAAKVWLIKYLVLFLQQDGFAAGIEDAISLEMLLSTLGIATDAEEDHGLDRDGDSSSEKIQNASSAGVVRGARRLRAAAPRHLQRTENAQVQGQLSARAVLRRDRAVRVHTDRGRRARRCADLEAVRRRGPRGGLS
jgi:hypothetical protein